MSSLNTLIRPAILSDVDPVVELVRLSMGAEADWLFGLEKNHPTDEVMSGLFQRSKNRVSHDLCWVAEVDGSISGALLAYPGRSLRHLELRTGLHLLHIFGFAATYRLAIRQPVYGNLVEAEKDEFYISNVAVLPKSQGRGIGAELMRHAEKLAFSRKLSKCSLIVTFDNPARRLYERLGYAIVNSLN
jgi:ribosomal protein S18 acetylase RimI-like enzyme